MISLRAFARSAPRALTRVSSSTLARSQSAFRTSSLLSSKTTTALRPQQASAFSTSLFKRQAAEAGEVDEELSAKLASEIEFEEEVKGEPLPPSIKDFIDNSPFELQDISGKEEVVLTRNYGNEKITVSFSIADLHSYDNEPFDEDNALADEDPAEEGKNQNGRQTENFDEEFDEEAAQGEAPVRCGLNIVIEKPNKGALSIEAVAEDGAIVVENMYYYKDAKLAHAADPEASHAAQSFYPGPPFGTLDEDLQILMERYLEDRGIDQTLAQFIPDYMDVKEEKEYLSWLSNVKGFIDA
ncbi:mitochondrial glycoprotein [Rhypophila decipiens]|uniref:Mitochondrial glycoprotein n=1 Tax=Rhypophila decipiens TaxID=261697 RepID=A0AAN7BCM7_9PEZI|nr:mitochondrial glycoprotein [Rhypophila decipiens]